MAILAPSIALGWCRGWVDLLFENLVFLESLADLYPPPLSPSAREGEEKASPSPCGRDLGWGIKFAREGEFSLSY
ncbi:hypothetical protein [Helicobacter sp. T3_23-1059]